MKTFAHEKSELHKAEVGEFAVVPQRTEYIFRKDDRAYETLIVLDGRVVIVDNDQSDDDETGQTMTFGYCIDEKVMLLAPETITLRSCDAYAATDCTVAGECRHEHKYQVQANAELAVHRTMAGLSAEDVLKLRQDRVEIDRHVSPFCNSARQVWCLSLGS